MVRFGLKYFLIKIKTEPYCILISIPIPNPNRGKNYQINYPKIWLSKPSDDQSNSAIVIFGNIMLRSRWIDII